jgi:hypothetical protein
MKKILIGLLLAMHPYIGQIPLGGITAPGGAACTAPTVATRWAAWDPANDCDTGNIPCTNGLYVHHLVDSVGGNSAQWPSTNGSAVYTTGEINGLPAMIWPNTSNLNRFDIGTPFTPNGTYTYFVVYQPTNTTTGDVLGKFSGSGAFQLSVASGDYKVRLVKNNLVVFATSTTAVCSVNTWCATLVQYNQPTGDWAVYSCAGGTCTSNSSGNSAQTFSASTDEIGISAGDGGVISFHLAELSYQTAISTTGYGAWAQCKYGI